MPTWIVMIAIGLPIAWLVAEFKGGRTTRLVLGLLAIAVFDFVILVFVQAARHYDRAYLTGSFQEMKRLVQTGSTNQIVEAMDAYQSAVTNDTIFTFGGSSSMYMMLKKAK